MADYPYFPLYVEDFAMGTAAMTPTAVGIYARCLCHQWAHGFVPNDRIAIARLSGALPNEVDEAWESLTAKLKETSSGRLQNARLERERAEMLEKIERRSTAGKAGAEARWGNGNRNATAVANALPTECERNGKQYGKTMARAFDSDSESFQGSISNGIQSPPPVPPPATQGGDSRRSQAWREVEGVLLKAGVVAASKAIAAAIANGCSTDHVTNVICHWNLHPGAWDAGALYQRIVNLRPDQDCSELWPPPQERFVAAKQREQSSKSHESVTSNRLADELRKAEDQKQLAELESRFGAAIDALPPDKIRKLIRQTFPTESELMLKRYRGDGPVAGLIRESIFSYLAVAPKEPSLILEAL